MNEWGKVKKFLLKFYLYGSLGFTTEILFTAATDIFHRFNINLPLDLKLRGHSYIWMFFIYGSGSFLFPFFYNFIASYKPFIRFFIVGCGIFVIEFLTGAFLDLTTGKCPWEYHSRFAVCGYIRLDYLPAWMLFGYILEEADKIFEKMIHGIEIAKKQ